MKREFRKLFVYAAVVIGLTFFVITFVAHRTQVNGESMYPAMILLYFHTIIKTGRIISNVSLVCREKRYRSKMAVFTLMVRDWMSISVRRRYKMRRLLRSRSCLAKMNILYLEIIAMPVRTADFRMWER